MVFDCTMIIITVFIAYYRYCAHDSPILLTLRLPLLMLCLLFLSLYLPLAIAVEDRATEHKNEASSADSKQPTPEAAAVPETKSAGDRLAEELQDKPEHESFDTLEFKDGRAVELSHAALQISIEILCFFQHMLRGKDCLCGARGEFTADLG